jgi:predicted metal-dependent hydrolase
VDDQDACRAALRRWVRRVASRELPALAARLSAATGLEPRSVTVTWPRTRWGSCSPAGDVRLSVDLLFLPEELARAVVVHELAHLCVLDHSARFWRELSRYDADCRAHRTALGKARDHLPGWALPAE